jgi:hypothetical protein
MVGISPLPHLVSCHRDYDSLTGYAMYSANIAINRVYRPVLDQLGITYPQYLVLSALWQSDGQTVGAIADRRSAFARIEHDHAAGEAAGDCRLRQASAQPGR